MVDILGVVVESSRRRSFDGWVVFRRVVEWAEEGVCESEDGRHIRQVIGRERIGRGKEMGSEMCVQAVN